MFVLNKMRLFFCGIFLFIITTIHCIHEKENSQIYIKMLADSISDQNHCCYKQLQNMLNSQNQIELFYQCASKKIDSISNFSLEAISNEGLHYVLFRSYVPKYGFSYVGYCLPECCTARIITYFRFKLSPFFMSMYNRLLPLEDLDGYDFISSQKAKKNLSVKSNIIIIVFIMLILASLLSTLFNHCLNLEIFQCFSIIQSSKKLLSFSQENNILSLDILKVICSICICCSMTILAHFRIPILGKEELRNDLNFSLLFFPFKCSFLCLDALLFASGYLTARALNGSCNGIKDVILATVIGGIRRYLRFFPVIAIMLLFTIFAFPFFIPFPFDLATLEESSNCEDEYSYVLALIKIFIHTGNRCMDHLWFISIIFYLYLISPSIIYLQKKRPIFALALIISCEIIIQIKIINRIMQSGIVLSDIVDGCICKLYFRPTPFIFGLTAFNMKNRIHFKYSKLMAPMAWMLISFYLSMIFKIDFEHVKANNMNFPIVALVILRPFFTILLFLGLLPFLEPALNRRISLLERTVMILSKCSLGFYLIQKCVLDFVALRNIRENMTYNRLDIFYLATEVIIFSYIISGLIYIQIESPFLYLAARLFRCHNKQQHKQK